MSKSLKRVIAALETFGLESTPIEMANETRTALQAADVQGCHIDQIAKSVIFRSLDNDACVLFITAGGRQVDLELASECAGQRIGKADANLIRKQTGFAIGGVSPIGRINPIMSFIDPRLLEFDVIYGAAGTPRHIFPILPQVLKEISASQVFDFAY
jgi:prolyl-tRNA editing enzyme YbaK/EbsC (Cys-tRNA(Pro) deacylase)